MRAFSRLTLAILVGCLGGLSAAADNDLAPQPSGAAVFTPVAPDSARAIQEKRLQRKQSLARRATSARSSKELDTLRGITPEERAAMRLRYKILHPVDP
jgi:hypothetical protein